ncbi:hypothetical protein [Photobacterium leiognathi]|uniref:hypothetical protein n=1 Tax=Photobacterium leiognathi TaxID=553611 RepID=UPI002980BE72|nr:hypothetical protein [Photobacterium leiognathi]
MTHPLSKIALKKGIEVLGDDSLVIRSNAKSIVISFANFEHSEDDDLHDLLATMINTANNIVVDYQDVNEIYLMFNDNFRLGLRLANGNRIDCDDEFFIDDVKAINNAILAVVESRTVMNNTINSMRENLETLRTNLESFADKGDTSSDSQKVFIDICIANVEHAINGIHITDFSENWN